LNLSPGLLFALAIHLPLDSQPESLDQNVSSIGRHSASLQLSEKSFRDLSSVELGTTPCASGELARYFAHAPDPLRQREWNHFARPEVKPLVELHYHP
jgi:hypothetical protein